MKAGHHFNYFYQSTLEIADTQNTGTGENEMGLNNY
jgi:hypothetical protein